MTIKTTAAELPDRPSGIGLRAPHFEDILQQKPSVGFLEAHSENYFRKGGIPYEYLMKLREDYPVSLHGVGLSLGSADGVSTEHLQKLKELVNDVNPVFVSEHLAWNRFNGIAVPDLLPLPLTKESFDLAAANISRAQDALGRAILIENPSACLAFTGAEMPEPAFLVALCASTGCSLLLDVNNVYVSARNIGFSPEIYIDEIPRGLVQEIHLAGYQPNTVQGHDLLIDAHNNPVCEEVWNLYAHALRHLGDIPTLIEWDNDLPPLSVLIGEARKADALRKKVAHAKAA